MRCGAWLLVSMSWCVCALSACEGEPQREEHPRLSLMIDAPAAADASDDTEASKGARGPARALAEVVPSGERGFTLELPRSHVASVEVGDRVNVLLVYEQLPAVKKEQRIPSGSLGESPEEPEEDEEARAPRSRAALTPLQWTEVLRRRCEGARCSITLSVTLEESLLLEALGGVGEFFLARRPDSDVSIEDVVIRDLEEQLQIVDILTTARLRRERKWRMRRKRREERMRREARRKRLPHLDWRGDEPRRRLCEGESSEEQTMSGGTFGLVRGGEPDDRGGDVEGSLARLESGEPYEIEWPHARAALRDIAPRDFVDLVLTGEARDESGRDAYVARAVLQNVPVLSHDGDEQLPAGESHTLTVALTASEVDSLSEHAGAEIEVLVRPRGEHAIESVRPMSARDVLRAFGRFRERRRKRVKKRRRGKPAKPSSIVIQTGSGRADVSARASQKSRKAPTPTLGVKSLPSREMNKPSLLTDRAARARRQRRAQRARERASSFRAPQTSTAEDNLSTFALDVDTGSFTYTRNLLSEGRLPRQEAVRVEEFINYIDYGYAPPRGDAPFTIHAEAAASPFDPSPRSYLLRVGLKARERGEDEVRAPYHLTFLIDTSGSMQGRDKLGLVQEGLLHIIKNMGERDTIAVVTFDDRARRLTGPLGRDRRKEIARAVLGVDIGGATAMGAGMEVAYEVASEGFVDGHTNRVIVLSDGLPNLGATGHAAILSRVREHVDRGVTMTAVGVGASSGRDEFMEQLADNGDGNYFHIDGLREAQRIFGEELTSTIELAAQDVRVQVAFDPERVESYRLLGYENRAVADEDFHADSADGAELGVGDEVTALYEITLAPGATGEALATVHTHHRLPGQLHGGDRQFHIKRAALQGSVLDASPAFQRAVAAATLAEVLRHSEVGARVDLGRLGAFIEQLGDSDLLDMFRDIEDHLGCSSREEVR